METKEHALLQNLINQLWDAGFRPFAGMSQVPAQSCQVDTLTEARVRKIVRQEIGADHKRAFLGTP